MARILVIGAIHPDGHRLLGRRRGIEVEELLDADEHSVVAGAANADAILIRTSKLGEVAIANASKLKVVSRHGVGYENVDLRALDQRKIPLTIVGGVNAVSVAEHTMFLLLAVMKAGIGYDRATREGRWDFRNTLKAGELDGKTLLVVGFGRIGREVARRASAFGMKIAIYDPFAKNVHTGDTSAIVFERLNDGLASADAVTLHVPLTNATRHMIDVTALACMKSSAVIISTARGGLIDEEALAVALRDGRLRGAGLDVFEIEPLASTSHLVDLENTVFSPHSAALTEECAARMAMVAAQNCLDGLDGTLDPCLVVNRYVLEQPKQ